jgi:hypothetical protein
MALVGRAGTAGQGGAFIGIIYFSKTGNSAIVLRDHEIASIKRGKRQVGKAKEIFIWIRYNPLKNLESAKGIQGNSSLFIWISLGE